MATGRRRRAFAVLLDAPADAFLGQQPGDEGEAGLAVLDGVAARRPGAKKGALRQVRRHVVGPAPLGLRGVAGEHALDDLHQRALLPDLAAPAVGEQCDPRTHSQAVAGKAAVGLVGRGARDDAAARLQGAIGQRGLQRELLAEHGVQVEAGARVS